MTTRPVGVLFVCLGNICRSPLAKFIFVDLAARRGVADQFAIDSCGTGGWHSGGPADPRTIAVAMKYGLDASHIARQLEPAEDFERFDHILAMDSANRERLLRLGAPPARVRFMREFDPSLRGRPEHELIVPDPYYGGPDGFEHMYHMLLCACQGLLEHCLDGDAPA